jgi:hypothetical protein
LYSNGIGLILGALSVHIPSEYNTFLGIPYSTNPAYDSTLTEIWALVVLGFAFLGVSGGMLATFPIVLKLEKQVSQIPPPPPNIAFCRYCGAQNTPDAVFCSKCGKKLTEARTF